MTMENTNNPTNNGSQSNSVGSFVLDERVVAALSYFVFFLPLILTPRSKFTLYHANQGLWLLIFTVVGSIVSSMSFLGFCLGPLVALLYLSFAIIGVVNAVNRKMEPLPGFHLLPVIIKY